MRGKQYADVTGVKNLFTDLCVSVQNELLSNPGPAFHRAYEDKVNHDIASRPWAYDWSYWPLVEADEMRAERREALREIRTRQKIAQLEARLAQLKESL